MLNIKTKILIFIVALFFCLCSISCHIRETKCKVNTNETIEDSNSNITTETVTKEFDKKDNAENNNLKTEIINTETSIEKPTPATKTPEKMPLYSDIHTALKDFNNKTTINADAVLDNALVEIDLKNNKIILKKNVNISKNIIFSKDCKVDLNGYTINLSKNSHIEIKENTNVTFFDNTGKGIIKKDNNLSRETLFIMNYGNLTIDGGTYKMNSGQIGTTIMLYCKDGMVHIKDGTFNVTTTNAFGYIIKVDKAKTIKIDDGSFNIDSKSGDVYAIKTYPPLINQTMNISINGGRFDIYSENGNTSGLDLHRGNKLYINNCYVKTHTVKSINSITTPSVALDFTMFKNAYIDGGTFIAIESDKMTNYDSLGLYESGNDNVVINGGKFYGNTSYSASYLTINDGIFSGIHSGLQLYGREKVVINGGIYESPWHGGIYASGKELHIQNAILGSPKWKESHFGKETDFQPQYEDGKYWDGTLYSCMYIGGPNNDVVVYMNNCKLAYTENLTTEYSIVLTSNHGHCNSALYISNTDAIKKIRVDGENDKGCKGNLYIRENVTYKGVYGKGYVETPKTAPLLNS